MFPSLSIYTHALLCLPTPSPHHLSINSRPSMASVSSPPTSLHLNNRLDLESIRVLISLVSQHICRFLSDPNARKALQQECIARISTRRHGHFEFSEHTVLSNLYWGIDAVEVAIQAECPEERTARLLNSERMLQIPALLDEHGSTAGMANQYLVSCSYFYLSLVRGLRGDKWQMAMHFLQALLVAPHRVRTEFAPDLCARLFNFSGGKGVTDEEMRQLARRYKDWLMYYQVILYGETPQKSMGEDMKGGASPSSRYKKSASDRYFYSNARADTCATHQDSLMLHPEYLPEYKRGEMITRVKSSMVSVLTHKEPNVREDGGIFFDNWGEGIFLQNRESFDLKRLQEMLEESQSNTSVSLYSLDDSTEASDSEEKTRHKGSHEKILIGNAGILAAPLGDRSSLVRSPSTSLKSIEACTCEAPKYSMHLEDCGIKTSPLLSNNTHSSASDLDLSIYDLRDVDSYPSNNCYMEYGTPSGRSPACEFKCFGKLLQKYAVPELISHGSFVRKRIDFSTTEKKWCESNSNYENDTLIMLRRFEKAVSSVCFSKGLGKCEDAGLVVTAVWEMLNNKPEAKYSTLKDITGKLMDIISTTKEEKVMKTSVSILLILIAEDSSIIQDIKRIDLHLYHLARALKTNVHEAAILIFLLRPSPSEIKDLELLPTLVEVACNSNSHIEGSLSLPLSPTAASIAMIEILVTAFDYVTNNMHMSAISSPQILSKLINVARNKKLEEGIALAAILVRCMRLNGNCRKFLSQVTPIDPFLHLLRSTERHAKYAAVEYFHEILQMPRSSVIGLLHQIQHQGSIGIMHSLMACIEQAQLEHQLLAAHLLLQLDMLEGSSGKSVFKKAAMEVLLKSVAFEECSTSRMLAAFILSNLGGTYAWTGESYTAAWLLKKAGLTSMSNKNVIRNIDWNDPCLQDGDMAAWSRKTARNIIKIGISIFEALAKGIQSKLRSVSRDCLIVVAWLGCEMASMPPSNLRYSACEMLLGGVAQFLHPGSELDERVLACLCLYNYASGKGMQKLMNFSEGLSESLRRLSGITWMAEELLKVTDYFLPTEPHVSCVHTQILEAGHFGSGAATALIFYKGQLCGGHSDGSIKVWDIEGQSGKLASEVKAHRKPLTCFALFEPGSSLLSGSADKTIRVWQLVNKQLECVDVIEIKEPIHKIGTYGNRIFVITKSRGLKVLHASRIVKSILNNKHAKCLAVTQAKIYLGCTDSSLQVVDTISNQSQEIKARVNKWHMQSKPINSICVYKDWIYSAGSSVEGSTSKEWRRHNKPQWAIRMGRGTCVQEMAMVEDFLYLTCSSYPSVLQIWLRGNPQKVGTLSAGSKITSLLTANDIVFCGTETGLIKAWIPV